MRDKYKAPAKRPLTLKPEQQKELLEILLKMMVDTKYIRLKCLDSHTDIYHEIVDKMDDLGIRSITEDWNVGNNTRDVEIYFWEILGHLIDFSKIKFEGVEE